ncbi:MAG TPA: hypothetical protein VEF91_03540 [Verrucomicrobiae bacterium]|nr:hypothetical protein [Verrucomicrobiae bacterium]
MKYGTIVGRIGIILLITGIIIAVVSKLRNFHRLSSNSVTLICVGLIVVGAILFVVFVIDFVSQDKSKKP